MLSKRKFDIFLIGLFLLFSWWLMDKSFRYDNANHQFLIARHQIGDFGLHLSLIRSFSWGDNFPAESPFFPGTPLPYHYYFDLLVGLLEKAGVRIDAAFNGLSILFFTALLFLIYKLPQIIFGKNKLLGILSTILFVFHSNLTFIDFFKEKELSLSIFRDFWFLPDYIHKGPFDGSIISILFTLNVYLNQRHLIAALAISLTIIYILLSRLMKKQEISYKTIMILGLILGFLSRVHTLTFFSTALVLFLFFVVFKRIRLILPFFLPGIIVFLFHLKDILGQDINHIFLNLGFLSEKPLSLTNFVSFWVMNLGIGIVLMPLGFFLSGRKQKLVFISVLSLFAIGNIFQLSFLINHNHSIFNFFLIFTNFYVAYFLLQLLQKLKNFIGRLIFVVLVFFLTISGVIDLMAVKNDFHYPLTDVLSNKFMQWIKNNTGKKDIFLAREEILDPITLSGRYNYLGHNYYLSVMGYDTTKRELLTKTFFEADSIEVINKMKKEKIKYIVIPNKNVPDFSYHVAKLFFQDHLTKNYEDNNVVVFKL